MKIKKAALIRKLRDRMDDEHESRRELSSIEIRY